MSPFFLWTGQGFYSFLFAEFLVPANHVPNAQNQSLLHEIGQKVRKGSLDQHSGPFRRGLAPLPRAGKAINSDYPLLTAAVGSESSRAEANFLFTVGKLTRFDASLNPADSTVTGRPYFNFHDPNGQYSKNISKAPPVGPLAVKMLMFVYKPLGNLGKKLRACIQPEDASSYTHDLFDIKHRV